MQKRDLQQLSLELHNKHKGKICITCKVPLKTKLDLSLAYTPGVAEPCREIVKNKDKYRIPEVVIEEQRAESAPYHRLRRGTGQAG